MSLRNTIACGDCREILPTLPAKSFQLAFADPPYWVGFDYGEQTDKEMEYINPEWLVTELLRVAECVLVTPGIGNLYLYPKSDWIIAWNKPGSTRRSARLNGFNIWEPVLVYGKPVKRVFQDAVNLPDANNHTSDGKFHKCPKPERLLNWLVENFSNPGDCVIDPVSGSGTTCKSAYQLGRNYFGIELDPKIHKLSLARLAKCQPPLLGVGKLTKRAPDLGYAPQNFLFPTDGDSASDEGVKPAPSG